MKVVRTIVWIVLLVAFLLFAFANWDQNVTVQIWNNLVWDTKLPAVVIVAFLLGLLPMWLLHVATGWQLRRRIGTLENTARSSATAPTPAARVGDGVISRQVDDHGALPGADPLAPPVGSEHPIPPVRRDPPPLP